MLSVPDLEQRIRAYLCGVIDRGKLDDYLTETAAEAAASDDIELRRLHNGAWLRIGEADVGLLSEEVLVWELTQMLQRQRMLTWGAPTMTFASAHRTITAVSLWG